MTASTPPRASARARRRAPFSPAVLALVVLGGGGCGPASPPPKPPEPPKLKPKAQLAPPPSPARWALNPAHAKGLRAKLDLGAAGVLYAGAGGVRWLETKAAAPVAADTTLPESVTGMIAQGTGLAFVAENGTVFTTATALGPVTARRAPPMALRSAVAGKAALVAVAGDELMRSTDAGATWTKATVPAGSGTPTHVALNESGVGLALLAPQRVLFTQDDGATWAVLASPSVGARKLVIDGNGDLMIEGLEASSILKLSPPRLEKVARAPREGYDLPAPDPGPQPGYAKAVLAGNAALVGLRYVEAIAEPEDPTRWRVAIGDLGDAGAGKDKSKPNGLTLRKVSELNGCRHVWVGGDAESIVLACDDQGKGANSVGSFGTGPNPKWGPPPPPENRAVLRILRSTDGGATFKDDGNAGSQGAGEGHVYVGPDGALFVEGACKTPKKGGYGYCPPSPPLVRPVGGKFAKVDLPGKIRDIGNLAFAPTSGRAYTTGKIGQSWVLLVSTNGGRDFSRVALPVSPSAEPKGVAIGPNNAAIDGPHTDESGVVSLSGHVGRDFVVWVSEDEGATVKVRRVPFKADAVSMVGKRGFAYDRSGKAWETADAGTTWRPVGAPAVEGANVPVVCTTHACLIGDRAVRIGWGGGADPGAVSDPKAKVFASQPALKCAPDGDWKPLGNLSTVPSVYDADLAGARFLGLRHDRAKGSVSVLLGKGGAKGGLDVKEVSLFGPAGANTATAALPQIEGAAAIRFTFKREPPPKPPESKDKDKDKKPAPPPPLGPIVENQKVDVDVAWYVASTGKVHKATLKGVGPLDPRDVSTSLKDAAIANVALLSVSTGEKGSGVHVRPFATKADVPLFYASDSGKVDRLPWPELPQKDVTGGALTLRTDAVRVGNRSVILGFHHGPGLQMWSSWANEAGTSWEPRTWGLWPSLAGEVSWDFTYLGTTPALVVQWPGGAGLPPTAWAAPLKTPDADPQGAVSLPTQWVATAGCEPNAAGSRVVAPYVGGSRRPVTVTGEGEAIVLATGNALLKGTGKSGCVAAWEARPVARPNEPPASTPYAALVAGNTKDAVLFRTNNLLGEVSARALTCAVTTDVPPGLEGLDGFQRDGSTP